MAKNFSRYLKLRFNAIRRSLQAASDANLPNLTKESQVAMTDYGSESSLILSMGSGEECRTDMLLARFSGASSHNGRSLELL